MRAIHMHRDHRAAIRIKKAVLEWPQTKGCGVFWQADEGDELGSCDSHGNQPLILKINPLWLLFIQQLSLIAK